MFGLIKKDILSIINYGKKTILFLFIYFGIMAFLTKNLAFGASMMTFFVVMLPMTALGLDEKTKWDKYAITMPVTRTQLALSKYYIGAILLAIVFFFTFIVNFVFTKELASSFFIATANMSVGIAFLSIILPISYKLGVEKGRYALILVAVIPTVFITTLAKNFDVKNLGSLKALPLVLLILVILTAILSVFISISIYNKKEF